MKYFNYHYIIKIKNNEKFFIILTVFFSTLFSRIYNLYSLTYHNFVKNFEFEILINTFNSIILTLPVIISSFFIGFKTSRFIAGLILLYAIYILFRTHFLIDGMDNYSFGIIIMAAMLMSAASLWYLSDRAWRQGARFILIAIVAWVLSPLLFAWIQSDEATHRTFTIERVVKRPPKAVVVVILDEMSPELAPLLRPALTAQDHTLHVGKIQKAGKDTIYAIPSMLAPKRHDGVVACGATRLCGDVFFDMARLQATQPDTDVVGFFHPYCAIQGLRSCWVPLPTHASSAELFNRMTAHLRLVTGGIFPKLNEPAAKWTAFSKRDAITQHALNAPFWSAGGGILYVHQYLPHPDGIATGLSLNDEYHVKMRQAVQLVSLIRDKLQRDFGKEYLLIVTSDHPLRTSMWCSKPAYESASCLKENFLDNDNVPFMVLAPKNVVVAIPTTNVGVFSRHNEALCSNTI